VSTGTFTLFLFKKNSDYINIIIYVIIGKQNCIECYDLKNLLHEKGTQYIFRYYGNAEKIDKLFENVL
jgi:hypothetical protein